MIERRGRAYLRQGNGGQYGINLSVFSPVVQQLVNSLGLVSLLVQSLTANLNLIICLIRLPPPPHLILDLPPSSQLPHLSFPKSVTSLCFLSFPLSLSLHYPVCLSSLPFESFSHPFIPVLWTPLLSDLGVCLQIVPQRGGLITSRSEVLFCR